MPVIDLVKALASQLIVWHHLAFYGPLSDVVYPHATDLIHWLYQYARVAVQVFLVTGGFLAARSLQAKLDRGARIEILKLVWQRYLRLAPVYLLALGCAVIAAGFARASIHHSSIPAAPTAAQLLSHALLLQSVRGDEALSAGVWYVAIDFQLFALLAVLFRFGDRFRIAACAGLAALSIFWLNRIPALDAWAPYFFGAYGIGVLACWISTTRRRLPLTACLAALVAAGLTAAWRERLLVAGITAVILAATGGNAPRWIAPAPIRFLGRISYSVFLIHYPVYLVVSAVVFRLWPDSWILNGAGMILTWIGSLGCGAILYQLVERPRPAQSATPQFCATDAPAVRFPETSRPLALASSPDYAGDERDSPVLQR